MKTSIAFEEAKILHPKEVKTIQDLASQRLKKSKAKNKAKDISELEWHYESCVMIQPLSLDQFISGNSQKKTLSSTQEKFEDEISRTRVNLVGCMKGARESIGLKEIPQSFKDSIKTSIENQEKEQQAYDSLSLEAKTEQMKNALKILSKGKGFLAIKV
ncbi:MAG: hypothetical protein AABY22_11675 [Nanoarchaeota archaeon]